MVRNLGYKGHQETNRMPSILRLEGLTPSYLPTGIRTVLIPVAAIAWKSANLVVSIHRDQIRVKVGPMRI